MWAAPTPRALISLFLHLEQMEKAGVPVRQSLQAAAADAEDRALKKALPLMVEELKAGRTLSEAMASYPDIFDPTLIRLAALGERAGKMGLVLERGLAYLKRKEELRAAVKSATRYPKVSGAIIFVLAAFRHDTDMPKLALCIFCLWAALKLSRRFLPLVKGVTDSVILGIPVIGKFVARYSFARFAESLATLFDAGISMREALPAAAETVPNLPIKNWILEAADKITAGQSVYQAFQGGRMDNLALTMLKTGERTGAFSAPLREMSTYYDRKLDESLTALHQVATPVITVVTGVFLYTT